MARAGLLAAAAVLIAGLLPAEALAQGPCIARNMVMRGAPGQSCDVVMPTTWDTGRGPRARHVDARLVRPPASGEVRFLLDNAANRFVVRYRPRTASALSDEFVFERCGETSHGSGCRPFRVRVELSGQAAEQARGDCTPAPFRLAEGRVVPVALRGDAGRTCVIRLFLANTPLDIAIETAPSSGRAWLRGPRVLYRRDGAGDDAFRVRACARGDGSRCTTLAVSVSLR